ncbi:ABC-type nitrate/sulfonate/bicarbonate transport system substrate-binding protein [Conyzicola nivalis]|uniref:Thiamine pyrimidine synthase n=1 Tax=Conyzicola nivalis TaxID=1477021 RepID=A0ABV2QP41_9MICO
MSARFSFSPRRKAAVTIAAAGIVLALAGCSSATPAADGDAESLGDLSLQLSWIKNEEFAGEFFALDKGYYADAGLGEVTMTAGPSTGSAELLSGTVDVALSDAVSIGTVVANEEAPLKIIGATFQKNPFTILSIADAGNILTPEDMVGKKIGVQASNTSLFEALLAANDIDPDSLEIVPVQYDPSVLINGDVDGFVAYLTNESISVAAEGYEVANLPFADNGLPFVAETVTVTDQTIAGDREKLKAFLIAEIKGWADAVNDPDAAAELALELNGAEAVPDIEKAKAGSAAQNLLIVSDDTEENGLFTISEDLQQQTVETLAAAGITVEASDLFDLSLLAEVYEENPELIAYSK